MKLKCILLIDDDQITNFINKKILDNIDAAEHVFAVESGEEALEYLTATGRYEGQQLSKPDLILLDINMPGIDGFEFIEKYKTLSGEQKGDVVVVMLTKSVFPHNEVRATSMSEISDFKYKPLTEELARELVASYFYEKVH